MKLVVGLGNPGRKYAQTRHNVGFDVLSELGKRHGSGATRSGFQGEVLDAKLNDERCVLLWPHTFMNKSGDSVLRARDFYKLELHELLIVCDDFNLPLAQLRFRAKGSAGGQKGLDDILRVLGTTEVPRLRIGIGQPHANWDPADYVLSKFSKDERIEMDLTVVKAADAVEVWTRLGIDACMNQFN